MTSCMLVAFNHIIYRNQKKVYCCDNGNLTRSARHCASYNLSKRMTLVGDDDDMGSME